MSLIVKLLIGLVVGAVASTLTSLVREGIVVDPVLLIAFCIATTATALIVAANASSTETTDGRGAPRSPSEPNQSASGQGAAREHGTVKWFNGTKGFGFIVKDDGEEIFVHFRSIRGEGRRSLRDGQQVSFVVAESDKGPQAEDVEGLG